MRTIRTMAIIFMYPGGEEDEEWLWPKIESMVKTALQTVSKANIVRQETPKISGAFLLLLLLYVLRQKHLRSLQ